MAFKKNEARVEVKAIEMHEINFHIVGRNMIMNRFSRKAFQELLYPSERKSRATLESRLKHDPLEEFRGAAYRNRDDKEPTLFHVPPGAFKQALSSVAVDIPGPPRAKLERLVKITSAQVNLYGVPKLFMCMVRNSDMNRTPDVRTRPVFPEFACHLKFEYLASAISERSIANLMGAAGIIIGVGDWRGGKGGEFGSYVIADEHDKAFRRIVREQGRKAQQEAWDNPTFFDLDSEELYAWFTAEVSERQRHHDGGKKKKQKVYNVTDIDGREQVESVEQVDIQ